MNDRTIYTTHRDHERLVAMLDSARSRNGFDERDRPYLASLEAELRKAVVVDSEAVPPDIVTMNSRVRLQDGPGAWTATLVFPEDADTETDRISVLAPLGAALLGCRAGSHISFVMPGGRTHSCALLSVLYQPEAAGDLFA